MARVIFLSEFKDLPTHRSGTSTGSTGLPPRWFFADASSYREGHKFTIESSYPFSCAMHEETVEGEYYVQDDRGRFRVELRRWIERNLAGDVVIEYLNKSYRVTPPPNQYNRYPDSYEIRHNYVVFHFETEADLFHFRMKYSEQVEEIQSTHPRKTK